MSYNKVALTGHRPGAFRPSQIDGLKDELGRIVDKLEPKLMISGMALGSDLWWAETAIEKDIPLHAYLPGVNQTNRWVEEDKGLYNKYIALAKEVFLAGQAPDILESVEAKPAARMKVMKRDYADHVVSSTAYHKRNRAMCNASDITVVVWNGKNGGTKVTWDWLKENNMPHILIDMVGPKMKTTIVKQKQKVEA